MSCRCRGGRRVTNIPGHWRKETAVSSVLVVVISGKKSSGGGGMVSGGGGGSRTRKVGSPEKRSDPKPVGTSRQTFVTDPSGNLVELHQATG